MRIRRSLGTAATTAVAITVAMGLSAVAAELTTEDPAEEVETVTEESDSTDGDPTVEAETDTAESSAASDDVGDTDTEASIEGQADEAEHPDNHGGTVSEFAKTTELTGCERGHAVSAVARGLDPADAKPCKGEGDAEAELEAENDEADVEDDAETSDDDDEDGPGNGKGRGNGNGNGRGKGGNH